jgi:putative Holliday junction resolvase
MTLFNYLESTHRRFDDKNNCLNILPVDLNAIAKLGKIMAIDVGTKRLGIAISDETRLIASPKMIINRVSNQKDFEKIFNFIEENKVKIIVVGLSVRMNNENNEMTNFCQKFAYDLDIFLAKSYQIILFDERLTSFEAREINSSKLSRKKNKFVDDIAASVMLKHFMDCLSV